MFSLKTGDKVGIISPAGCIPGFESIRIALNYLENLGYQYITGEHIYSKYLYMAGTDEQRASDLMSCFKNPDIKAIFTTAGGCGSQKILDLLDYNLIAQNPKPIIGLSDNTALQLGIYSQTRNLSITGFSLKYDCQNGSVDSLLSNSLQQVLSGHKQSIQSGQAIRKGQAEGILLGGCLSLIRSLAGTKYFPDLSDKILIIEDVGEKTYKLDLMLTQLSQQPHFDRVKAIIFGQFSDCSPADAHDGTVDEIITEFCRKLPDIPIIKNFAYGHIPSRYVLPLGTNVRLDADHCRLTYL